MVDSYDLQLKKLIKKCQTLGIPINFDFQELFSGKIWISPNTPVYIKNDPIRYLEDKLNEYNGKSQHKDINNYHINSHYPTGDDFQPINDHIWKNAINVPKNIFIIDCLSPGNGISDAIKNKVSEYFNSGNIKGRHFRDNNQLLNFLYNTPASNHDIIHIISHGLVNKQEHGIGLYFEESETSLLAKEFPADCFCDKVVTMAACRLGDPTFAVPFIRITGARCLMAATNDLYYDYAHDFFVKYYSKYAQNDSKDALQTYKWLLMYRQSATHDKDAGIQFYIRFSNGAIERYVGPRLAEKF